jgi:hypothetical protein
MTGILARAMNEDLIQPVLAKGAFPKRIYDKAVLINAA